MRCRRLGNQRRRGTTVVEGTFVLLVFLTLVVGLFDLGFGVFQSHVVSQAACQGARLAIVHGNTVPRATTSWGPSPAPYPGANPYTVKGDTSADAIATALQPYLAGLNPGNVTITVQWLDGGNAPEQRVRVTISTSWKPATTLIFNGSMAISASSTMPIAF